jgi:hypothetical protein
LLQHLGPRRLFIVLSVLWSTNSHYPFGLYKHFWEIERKLQMEEKEQRSHKIRNNELVGFIIVLFWDIHICIALLVANWSDLLLFCFETYIYVSPYWSLTGQIYCCFSLPLWSLQTLLRDRKKATNGRKRTTFTQN